jgi:hypothetical protein
MGSWPVLENPPTAKSLLVGAVDRLRLILNSLFVADKDEALQRRPIVLPNPQCLFATDEIIVLSNGKTSASQYNKGQH